jgi:hypothetical protein
MNSDPKKPQHQANTEFAGERYEFESEALLPDDPRLEPRIRKGRPADRKTDPRFDPPVDEKPE